MEGINDIIIVRDIDAGLNPNKVAIAQCQMCEEWMGLVVWDSVVLESKDGLKYLCKPCFRAYENACGTTAVFLEGFKI